jgi:hypothetical protein
VSRGDPCEELSASGPEAPEVSELREADCVVLGPPSTDVLLFKNHQPAPITPITTNRDRTFFIRYPCMHQPKKFKFV